MKKNNIVFILTFIACIGLLTACSLKHEHSYKEWEITKEATCTEEGIKVRKCSCGETETELVKALGHQELIYTAVEATCTSTGLTEGKQCRVCNEVLVAQEIVEKIPHENSHICGMCNEVNPDFYTPGLVFSNVPGVGYMVSSYIGTEKEIYIPARYNNEDVVAISNNVFAENINIEVVHLPESITKIGKEAFSGCINLKEINIPSQVTQIENRTFYNCGLQSFVISENIGYIGEEAFGKNQNLEFIFIPKTVTIADSNIVVDCNNCSVFTDYSVNEIEWNEEVAIYFHGQWIIEDNEYKHKCVFEENYTIDKYAHYHKCISIYCKEVSNKAYHNSSNLEFGNGTCDECNAEFTSIEYIISYEKNRFFRKLSKEYNTSTSVDLTYQTFYEDATITYYLENNNSEYIVLNDNVLNIIKIPEFNVIEKDTLFIEVSIYDVVEKYSFEILSKMPSPISIKEFLERQDTVNSYYLRGIVTAISSGSSSSGYFVISDETGSLYCYQSSNASLGDEIYIRGLYKKYNGFGELVDGRIIGVYSTDNDIYKYCDKTTDYTVEDMLSTNLQVKALESKYLSITGYYSDGCLYANSDLTNDSSREIGIISHLSLSLFNGNKVKLYGYFIGNNTRDEYKFAINNVEFIESKSDYFNISLLDSIEYSYAMNYGNFQINANETYTLKVEDDEITYDDAKYYKKLILEPNGNKTYQSLKITCDCVSDIIVLSNKANSVYLISGNTNSIISGELDGEDGNFKKTIFENLEIGDYYLVSKDAAADIYMISLVDSSLKNLHIAQYTGSTTTNMIESGDFNAKILGLDTSVWEVTTTHQNYGSNLYPGLNKDGSIRIYASRGNTPYPSITFTNKNQTISYVEIDASVTSIPNISFYVDGNLVAPVDGKYIVNGSSFSIVNETNSSTIYIYSVSIHME